MRASGSSFTSGYGAQDAVAAVPNAGAPLFATVGPNVVQSIRAFRPPELQQEAARLGQHFLYAHCAAAQTRQQVLAAIAQAFGLPKSLSRNAKGLAACLTALPHKAGFQRGFVVVVEQLPNTDQFDRDARETVLDIFRDAAEYWAERKIPFRVFYSFK